jgi:peptide/nickel transport system substrate-binding protein
MLEQIGVHLKLVPILSSNSAASWRGGGYEGYMLQSLNSGDPGATLNDNFVTLNMVGPPPAQLKSLVDKALGLALGSKERETALVAANEEIVKNPVHVIVCALPNVYATQSKLQGVDQMGWPKVSGASSDIRGLWIAKAKK